MLCGVPTICGALIVILYSMFCGDLQYTDCDRYPMLCGVPTICGPLIVAKYQMLCGVPTIMLGTDCDMIYDALWSTYHMWATDQNQNSLLVKHQNDNTSPGIGVAKYPMLCVVPTIMLGTDCDMISNALW